MEPASPELLSVCVKAIIVLTKEARSSKRPTKAATSKATFKNGIDCLSHGGLLLSLGMAKATGGIGFWFFDQVPELT